MRIKFACEMIVINRIRMCLCGKKCAAGARRLPHVIITQRQQTIYAIGARSLSRDTRAKKFSGSGVVPLEKRLARIFVVVIITTGVALGRLWGTQW